jgi:hypothetical protein
VTIGRRAHGNGAGFVTIAPFLVDGLNAGKRFGRIASRSSRMVIACTRADGGNSGWRMIAAR